MSKEINELARAMNYYIESADRNLMTAENLFRTKDYDWSLFIGHLVIENC